MNKKEELYKIVIFSMFLVFLHSNLAYSAILPNWADKKAYYPVPVAFVHGMNSSPEAWGFQIDSITENVIGYTKTSEKLLEYFDKYRDLDPRELVRSPYIEPFNYGYNTFDAVEWNSYEGYNNTDLQYPDNRIAETRFKRPTLRRYIHKSPEPPVDPVGGILSKYQTTKTNLVAHSLGGVVSRYYINKTQGANVKQLTTLGTPHKGALVATVVQYTILDPITDPLGWRRIWRIRFSGILFRGISVDREPVMIYRLKPSSQFIKDLNSSIPAISRYYCIGGTVRGFPPIIGYTDGFIELVSALAEERNILPSVLPAESQLKSILPNYKGRILVPGILNPLGYLGNNHLALPEKWEEILKAIDPAGRVEITEPKDGFSPPQEEGLIVKGKVYDEYLPADCKVMVWVLREGELDMRVINNPNPESGEPEWVWRLSPTDLWRADDQNSPVAEFEIHIPAEYAMKVEKVKVTVTNPGGYVCEDEVSWNLLIVDEGTKEVYCLDGPITMRVNYPKVVNGFRLVDEGGNEIESRPLGVAWDDTLGIFYASFDDKKIRAYNEYGELVKTNSGRGYMEVPEMPDGLVNPFNNGRGKYVSEDMSIGREINYFDERIFSVYEIFLYTPQGYSLDSVKVNPTDGGVISCFGTWYSSKDLGLVFPTGRYDYFGGLGFKIPLGFSPTGLVSRGGYFYLVSSDGRLYKKYYNYPGEWIGVYRNYEGTEWQHDGKYFSPCHVLISDYVKSSRWGILALIQERSFALYDLSELPEGFQTVKIPFLITRYGHSYYSQPIPVNVYLDVVEGGWDYEDISWTNQPDILEPFIHLIYPPFYGYDGGSYEEVVIDVTDVVRDRLALGEEMLYIRCKTDEEGEDIEKHVRIYSGPMYVEETSWAIDLPSETPSDLGLGGKLKMRIKPGYLTSVNVGNTIQLEVHGKEPLEWITSDETIGRVDTRGLFTAVGKGTCTVTVQDALGNTATSGVILVQ